MNIEKWVYNLWVIFTVLSMWGWTCIGLILMQQLICKIKKDNSWVYPKKWIFVLFLGLLGITIYEIYLIMKG